MCLQAQFFLKREAILLGRNPLYMGMPLCFAYIILILCSCIPGIEWSKSLPYLSLLAFVLAHWLSLEMLFQDDFKQQVWLIWKSNDLDFRPVLYSKIGLHYFGVGGGLLLGLGFFQILNGVDTKILSFFLLALFVASAIFSLFASFVVALLLGLPKKNGWIGILLLPFYIPILIFTALCLEEPEFIWGLVGTFLLLVLVLPGLTYKTLEYNLGS
ncbi:MAG: heme exporter protein CcmB [Gammaproteobacteria bacterium]